MGKPGRIVMVTCPSCGYENDPIYAYCLSCGRALEIIQLPTQPMKPQTLRVNRWCLRLVRMDGSFGNEYLLNEGPNTIGRGGPEVRITEDPWVEERHAVIQVTPDMVFLQDLGTDHGTYVRIKEDRVLVDKDLLRIGHSLFEVQIGLRCSTAVKDDVAFIGSSWMVRDVFGRLVRLGPNGTVFEAYFLRAPETVLGRTSGDILMSEDPFVSARHATFRWENNTCVLRDLGSTNGCYLRVRGRTEIRDGTYLLIGHHLFQLSLIKSA